MIWLFISVLVIVESSLFFTFFYPSFLNIRSVRYWYKTRKIYLAVQWWTFRRAVRDLVNFHLRLLRSFR